jgi:hypothetical protein
MVDGWGELRVKDETSNKNLNYYMENVTNVTNFLQFL